MMNKIGLSIDIKEKIKTNDEIRKNKSNKTLVKSIDNPINPYYKTKTIFTQIKI